MTGMDGNGGAALIRGNALMIPLADASVDTVISSPPYFALRSYQDDGEHFDGQLGSEPTPADFLRSLWLVLDECHRVLKPTGSLFLNLGDKYAGGGGYFPDAPSNLANPVRPRGSSIKTPKIIADVPVKSLMGLPWRLALGLIVPDPYRTCYQPGAHPQWTMRAEVIWDKPNGLPESVADRVRRSHEQWFHLSKAPRYFAAIDEVREAHADTSHGSRRGHGEVSWESGPKGDTYGQNRTDSWGIRDYNPLGKLPGSVWRIPSEPLKVPAHINVDHFAAFPQEIVRRIILGWSPLGICTACGEGRRPVVEKEREFTQTTYTGSRTGSGVGGITNPGGSDWLPGKDTTSITGYACACPTPDAPTRPAIVLDPFSGTGTVSMVARSLGRYGIGIDLSADYLRLAQWRIWESGNAGKTIRRTNLERQGQLDLYGASDTPAVIDLSEGGI